MQDDSALSIFNNDERPIAVPLLLEALKNNLQQLDKYLPPNDEEQRFKVLKRLSQLLLLLHNVAIYAGDLPVNKQEDYVKSAVKESLAAIGVFADYLESLQDTLRGLDYLKMADALWSDCIRYNGQVIYAVSKNCLYTMRNPEYQYRSGRGSFEQNGLRYYTIPSEIIQRIEKRRMSLDDAISLRDPAYTRKYTHLKIISSTCVKKSLEKDVFQSSPIVLWLAFGLLIGFIWICCNYASFIHHISNILYSPFELVNEPLFWIILAITPQIV